MQRRLALFALVVSALALAAIASACGDGELTLEEKQALEEYFQRVRVIQDEQEEPFRAPQYGGNLDTARDPEAPVQDRIEAFRNVLEQFLVISEAAEKLDDLDPPAQAEEAHNELVDSTSEFADINDGLSDRAKDVDSQSDLENLLAEWEGPEALDAENRVHEACLALQTIAGDNNVEVDLDCVPE